MLARLDELEGCFVLGAGFDEAGGPDALGFSDTAHCADHGGVDTDVLDFDSGNEEAPLSNVSASYNFTAGSLEKLERLWPFKTGIKCSQRAIKFLEHALLENIWDFEPKIQADAMLPTLIRQTLLVEASMFIARYSFDFLCLADLLRLWTDL